MRKKNKKDYKLKGMDTKGGALGLNGQKLDFGGGGFGNFVRNHLFSNGGFYLWCRD